MRHVIGRRLFYTLPDWAQVTQPRISRTSYISYFFNGQWTSSFYLYLRFTYTQNSMFYIQIYFNRDQFR